MASTIHGDLLKLATSGRFDVIIHGCNCQCTMGAGIAKQIRAQFPEAFAADCQTTKGSQEKLGTISTATIMRGDVQFVIVNGYTQFHWRGTGLKADYTAIREVMRHVKCSYPGTRIGYPQIGAGLAGGEWPVIAKIIDEELSGENHTLVLFGQAPLSDFQFIAL